MKTQTDVKQDVTGGVKTSVDQIADTVNSEDGMSQESHTNDDETVVLKQGGDCKS